MNQVNANINADYCEDYFIKTNSILDIQCRRELERCYMKTYIKKNLKLQIDLPGLGRCM